MLSLLILDALSALGYADAMLRLGKWLLVGVFIGFVGYLWLEKHFRGPEWQEAQRRREEQRLARRIRLTVDEAQQQTATKRSYIIILLLFAVLVAVIVALSL